MQSYDQQFIDYINSDQSFLDLDYDYTEEEQLEIELSYSNSNISTEDIESLLYCQTDNGQLIIPKKVAASMGAISEEEKDEIIDNIFKFKKKYKKGILFNFNIPIENIHNNIQHYVNQKLFDRIKNYLCEKNLKDTLEKKYRKLLILILANLYNAYYYRYFLMINKNNAYYSNKEKVTVNQNLFSAQFMRKLFHALYSENLLIMKKGFHSKDSKIPNSLTRYFPQNELLTFFQDLYKNNLDTIRDDKYTNFSDDKVLLRDVKEKNEKKGKVINDIINNGIFPKYYSKRSKISKLRTIKNEVDEINSFLINTKIEIHNPVKIHDKVCCAYYYAVRRLILKLEKNKYLMLDEAKKVNRIFNDRDITRGGRLYGSFQKFSSNTRLNFKMNDEDVESIDIKGSHIRMLYHFCNLEYKDDDPYELLYDPEIHTSSRCKHVRKINKLLLQILINSRTRGGAIQAAHQKGLLKYSKKNKLNLANNLYDIVEKKNLKKTDLANYWLELFENKHKPIKNYFYSEIGTKLQYIESQIIIKSMLDLYRKYSIPSLPIHDELIVPYSKKSIAKAVIEDQYRLIPEFNGHEVILEFKSDSN